MCTKTLTLHKLCAHEVVSDFDKCQWALDGDHVKEMYKRDGGNEEAPAATNRIVGSCVPYGGFNIVDVENTEEFCPQCLADIQKAEEGKSERLMI